MLTVRSTGRLVSILVVFSAALVGNTSAQEPNPTREQYLGEFRVYRVSGTPITLTPERITRLIDRDETQWAEKLNEPVSLSFKDLPIRTFTQYFGRTYGIEIVVDDRVVAPTGESAAGYATDGIVPYLKLDKVSLLQALDAALRPLGLSYSEHPGFLWVSTPERVGTEGWRERYVPDDRLTPVSGGALHVGDATVKLGPQDGRLERLDIESVDGVTLLTAPNILTFIGEPASITIQNNQPIEYFEPFIGGPEDTLYVLRKDERTEISISFEVQNATERHAMLDVGYGAQIVAGREPLEGTYLRAGKPVFETKLNKNVFSARLNQRQALLTEFGEDILLVVYCVRRGVPESFTTSEGALEEFSVESRFTHIAGRHDASMWNAEEGAASADSWLGPRSMKNWDRWQGQSVPAGYGFEMLTKSELVSAPRVTYLVDAGDQRKGSEHTLFKLVVSSSATHDGGGSGSVGGRSGDGGVTGGGVIGGAFSRVSEVDWLSVFSSANEKSSPHKNDYVGKAIIADIGSTTIRYREPEAGIFSRKKEYTTETGTVMSVEAHATGDDGVYRVNQRVHLRWERFDRPESPVGVDEARDWFLFEDASWSYDVRDGESIAYLLPAGGDEYVLVVSTFSLVD